MCVGGVLDDNGNWLYDHSGVTSTHQSAIITELSGLILSAILTVSDYVMSYYFDSYCINIILFVYPQHCLYK